MKNLIKNINENEYSKLEELLSNMYKKNYIDDVYKLNSINSNTNHYEFIHKKNISSQREPLQFHLEENKNFKNISKYTIYHRMKISKCDNIVDIKNLILTSIDNYEKLYG